MVIAVSPATVYMETYWLRLTDSKGRKLRAAGPCLLFVGPPHGYCEKLLGASIFVGYFIVLFYVTIAYHICDWRLASYILWWL